jgi:DNA-binding transcriptional LysR family regulator
MGVPKSGVSRSLARLERAVGAVLVDRSTRHLRLTDAGTLFRPHALRILTEVAEAGSALDGLAGEPSGTLKVSLPLTVAAALVSPMLPSFMAAYPQVRVILAVENRFIDMPAEPVELVIRVGPLPDSDLIARKLLVSEAWTCASPAYLAARGTPTTLAELHDHILIGYSDSPIRLPVSAANSDEPTGLPAAAISDSVAMLPAILGGAGIADLPDFLVAPHVADGRLTRLWPEIEGRQLAIHAIYPSHRSLSAKVRVFIDALMASIANRHLAEA